MTEKLDAAWAFLTSGWTPGVRFTVQDGRVVAIATGVDTASKRMAIPRIPNAHSHAFQWRMRGHSHAAEAGHEDDDFWSWRREMYGLASSLTADDVEQIASEAYRAMVRAGFSWVGEFHYLHHPLAGDGPMAMAEAHVRAARTAGIGLTLLPVAYNRGGFGKPAAGAQLRFSFPDVEAFLSYTNDLRDAVAGEGVVVGIGVHSVRAVPREWLGPIARAGREADVPIHIHASEQRAELRECRREHGVTPIRLLAEEEFLGPSTTIVHATHVDDEELDLLEASDTLVCACPSTERDLGDGLLRASDMLRRGIRLCVGSDSHVVVDAREELRLLELHERLRVERRNVLTLPEQNRLRPGDVVLAEASTNGAASLGVPYRGLEVGAPWPPIFVEPDADIASRRNAERAFDRWLFC